MKVLFYSLFFINCLAASAQQNQTDSKGRKQGEWVKYYPNSRIAEYKGSFIDGKPNGVFNYYEKDGGIKMIANHDAKTGRSAVYYYHTNNTIKSYGIYKNMKKDSIWTYYSNTGVVSKRESYKNDLLEGITYVYYVNSMTTGAPAKVAQETPYINNKKNGIEKEYFTSGVLKQETSYKNGNLNGFLKRYTPGGTLESEAYYFDNSLHGFAYVIVDGKKEYSYYIYGKKVEPDKYKKWLEHCKANNIKTNIPGK